MVFSSFIFLGFFLPVVLLAYFGAIRFTHKLAIANKILLAASLLFYAWGEPLWILLLIAISLFDYLNGKRIQASDKPAQRKCLLFASVGFDIGILFVFKYLGFFAASIDGVFGLGFGDISIRLPIGISFYIFQSLSYVSDVYTRRIPAQTKYLDYVLFVSMFPQLVAGPIVRYADIAESLRSRHTSLADFSSGAKRFTAGLCKKIILANRFGAASAVLLDGSLSGLSMAAAWLGILFFALQIYFDFSGYSDMAIGLGRIFGFKYKENFDYPYISTSITAFWRRWHISLGSFFRDYVYIPLGGNRRRHIRNMLIVWLLTGLWHGASWNFVLWGLYYGLLLLLEKWAQAGGYSLHKPLAWLASMILVLYGWGIFYYTDFMQLRLFSRAFLGINGLLQGQYLRMATVWSQHLWLLLVGLAAASPFPHSLYQRFIAGRRPWELLWDGIVLTGAWFVCFVLLVGESYNPFLYFRF